MRSWTIGLALCGVLAITPTAGAIPTRTPAEVRRPNAVARLLRKVQTSVKRTFERWNQPPTRAQALRPLQRMIDSGRISGGDLDRVRSLYPGLNAPKRAPTIKSRRSDPRMKPLFRMLDSGRISRTDFVRIEQALGR